jgi:hypothetical protein
MSIESKGRTGLYRNRRHLSKKLVDFADQHHEGKVAGLEEVTEMANKHFFSNQAER